MIYYKINPIEELNKKGYSIYRLKKEHIFSQSKIYEMAAGNLGKISTLEKLCSLLNMPVDKIIGYKEDEND